MVRADCVRSHTTEQKHLRLICCSTFVHVVQTHEQHRLVYQRTSSDSWLNSFIISSSCWSKRLCLILAAEDFSAAWLPTQPLVSVKRETCLFPAPSGSLHISSLSLSAVVGSVMCLLSVHLLEHPDLSSTAAPVLMKVELSSNDLLTVSVWITRRSCWKEGCRDFFPWSESMTFYLLWPHTCRTNELSRCRTVKIYRLRATCQHQHLTHRDDILCLAAVMLSEK